MRTLDFRHGLVAHPFARSNGYMYHNCVALDIYFSDSDSEMPYIMKEGDSRHPQGMLWYSMYGYQLSRRILNTARIKEVLDSAGMPIMIKLGDQHFLIGKGFLAHYDMDTDKVELLFVAQVPRGKSISHIQQVKFYVSRLIYEEKYKKILPAMKDIINEHVGDVLITSNLNSYVGARLETPDFKSIREKKDYIDNLFPILMKKVMNA